MKNRIQILLLCIICSSSLSAQVDDFDYLIEKQKVTSKHLNEEHSFNVYLPLGYHDSSQNYPVLYVLDLSSKRQNR